MNDLIDRLNMSKNLFKMKPELNNYNILAFKLTMLLFPFSSIFTELSGNPFSSFSLRSREYVT